MRLVILLLIVAGAQVRGSGQNAAGFVLAEDDGTVRVYTRAEADGEMSVRVTAHSPAPVASVVAVLDAVDDYPAWVHRCAHAYALPGRTPAAFVYYSRVDLPFPFGDREVVAAVHQATDPATGVWTRQISSRPDAVPPTDGVTRIVVYEAEWRLSPRPGGGTDLSCTVRTGAGKGLPRWLRRQVMTGGPARTVRNLLGRVGD